MQKQITHKFTGALTPPKHTVQPAALLYFICSDKYRQSVLHACFVDIINLQKHQSYPLSCDFRPAISKRVGGFMRTTSTCKGYLHSSFRLNLSPAPADFALETFWIWVFFDSYKISSTPIKSDAFSILFYFLLLFSFFAVDRPTVNSNNDRTDISDKRITNYISMSTTTTYQFSLWSVQTTIRRTLNQ